MKKQKHTGWAEILIYEPLRYFLACGSVVLLVVWLCLTVPKWVASFKDEVEYSEDLKDHTPAYADIVSIEPVEETFALSDEIPDLYCKCELVGGDTVWVRFTVTQYVDFIDSSYLEPDTAEEIIYSTPIRVHGAVDTVGRVIDAFRDNNNFVLIVDSAEVLQG